MVPTRNLLHHDNSSSQYCITTQLESHKEKPSKLPRLMDDEGPRGHSGRSGTDERQQTDEVGTSSRVGDEGQHKDWLQLGLGTASSSSSSGDNHRRSHDDYSPMELDLFSEKPRTRIPITVPPLFALPIRSAVSRPEMLSSYHGRYMMASSSMRGMPPMLPFSRPLTSSGLPIGPDAGDMRVISPPRRPETGVWLLLQAAPNQVREPILPQIPKSYLRIKDSNMKVEVLMKYLTDKLGLKESKVVVELTCRGQLLPAFLAVQHVRDNIWCSTRPEAALVDPSATTHHVMTLFYSTCSRNY